MRKIEEIENFLRETPVFYLATIDENRPKCRPIGFHLSCAVRTFIWRGNL